MVASHPDPARSVSGQLLPAELFCIHCGYTLDQVNTPACPECGTPVQTSREGDGLHLASPVYLRTLLRGQRVASRASCVLFLFFLLTMLLPAVSRHSGVDVAQAATEIVIRILVSLTPAVCVCILTGWYLISSPDARFKTRELPNSCRLWTRRLVVLACLAWTILTIGLIAIPDVQAVMTDVLTHLLLAGAVALHCGAITIAALHVRLLARRMSATSLEKACKFFTLVMIASTGIIVLKVSRLLPAGHLYSALSLAAFVLAVSYYWSIVIEFGKAIRKLNTPTVELIAAV